MSSVPWAFFDGATRPKYLETVSLERNRLLLTYSYDEGSQVVSNLSIVTEEKVTAFRQIVIN